MDPAVDRLGLTVDPRFDPVDPSVDQVAVGPAVDQVNQTVGHLDFTVDNFFDPVDPAVNRTNTAAVQQRSSVALCWPLPVIRTTGLRSVVVPRVHTQH